MSASRLESQPQPEQSKLIDQIEVLHRNEITGNLVAMVPVDLVYMQDVPVDSSHVMDLADSIKKEAEENGGHGQLSPVSLAEVIDFNQLPIMDGFHRTPAVKSLGRTEVFATVRPNSTWDDVIDHRILAATTHRSVRFSRVVEWVEESWRRTPWAKRIGSISAFNLSHSKTSTGERLGLAPEEVEQIKEWVTKKCDFWHLSPFTIYNNLTIARSAAPELVHEARERRQGRTLEALTPMHLSVVTKTLPHDFEKQRLLADIAKKHAMTVPKTRAAAMILRKAKNIKEAKKIIEETDWSEIEPVLDKPSNKHVIRPIEHVANANYVLSRLEDTVKLIGHSALKKLDSPEDTKDKSEHAEVTKRLRQIGNKCLDLADSLDEKAGVTPTPDAASGKHDVFHINSSDKPLSHRTEVAMEKLPARDTLEDEIIKFVKIGGKFPELITSGDVEVARQVLGSLSGKALEKDKLMVNRYRKINLASIEAEKKLLQKSRHIRG